MAARALKVPTSSGVQTTVKASENSISLFLSLLVIAHVELRQTSTATPVFAS